MLRRQSLPPLEAPGIYIHEVSGGSRPIAAVGTSTAGFVGVAPKSHNTPIAASNMEAQVINNWTQFQTNFFSQPPVPLPDSWKEDEWTSLAYAVYGFFLNGGRRCWVVDTGEGGTVEDGLEKLAQIDEIAIVAAPGATTEADYDAVRSHCEAQKDRVGILDAPQNMTNSTAIATWVRNVVSKYKSERGFVTMYLPWIKIGDPRPQRDLKTGLIIPGQTKTVPPSGHVAGIWARNDATRGVHKAPANEIVNGALGLDFQMTNQDQKLLNDAGVNGIRFFRDSGYLVWGGRALAKDSEWRYLNVRRLFNMVEESIAESTRWIVFEPNDESLWGAIRRDVGAFLTGLWRQGALMGSTPQEAFFVKCDAENNPPDSIRLGQVIIDIGIAPVLPADFVIFRISQYEAGTDVEIA
jgi:phage tail sheath protein FI